jgi:hypothetical protein
MRFGLVPHVAVTARPWADVQLIGPPPGWEDKVGSLSAQVDNKTQLGRGYRFFAELEDGDAEAIASGMPIEFVVYAQQMVPVSVAVWR